MSFRAHLRQHYAVDLQDGEEVHSVRSVELQDDLLDDRALPLQEHHLDRPVALLPRQHSAYAHSSSDNDDPDDLLDDLDARSVDSYKSAGSRSVGSRSTGSRSAAARTPSRDQQQQQHYQQHHQQQQQARYHGSASPSLQPSSVVAFRKHASSSPGGAALRRPSNATPLAHTAAYERKRGGGGGSGSGAPTASSSALMARMAADERSVFARIYFETAHFTSSTVFKLFSKTTVLDVRRSMASKIKIPSGDFGFFVIVVVFPGDSGSLSARTLRDEELMMPLVEKLNRARSNTAESDEALGAIRAKPKHRALPPVKFVLKDVRGAPLELDEPEKKAPVEVQALHFPVLVGKGVHSGYLQKASVKDANVWRKRWFVLKGDQLLYSKSASNPREVTAVSLLNAYLAKPRPELRISHAFELRTPRRVYQLCASTKDEYVAWVHALHVQISISTDNHRLYEAEILITEDAVARSEEDAYRSRYSEPSLLQQIISREDTLKIFRDFVYNTPSQVLLDTWIECELFRRSCIARENALLTNRPSGLRRSAKDEWEHLRLILDAVSSLSMIGSDDIVLLRQSYMRTEQISRRLSLAMHASSETAAAAAALEYPRVELIATIHQKLFKAIEAGPFQQFVMEDGYRQLLGRTIGRLA